MKMLGSTTGFVRAIAVASTVYVIVLSPFAAIASWEIHNPITDTEYWTHSDIEANGQGDLGAAFKTTMVHGSIVIAEKTGTTDASEGQWDHTFEPPPSGWPSGAKEITLWSKNTNNVYASVDEVIVMIVHIE